MDHPDQPIYVRNLTGVNDDYNTPEGKTFIHFESVMAVVLLVLYLVGHYLL